MPTEEYPIQLQLNGGLTVPWAELVEEGDESTSAPGQLGRESGCQKTTNILVYYSDLFTAVNQICGVYQTNNLPTPSLTRQLPLQHPRYQNMWADRIIKFGGYRFAGNLPNPQPGNLMAYPQYDYGKITVLFTTPHYLLLTDNEVDAQFGQPLGFRQEQYRFIEYVPQYTGEFAKVSKGNLIWLETSGPNGPLLVNPGNGKAEDVPITTGRWLSKPNFMLRWRHVPTIGLFDDNMQPTNIINGVGSMNSTTFLGIPAGLLYLDVPRFIQEERPVDASLVFQSNGFDPLNIPLDWTVEFPFKYFDPPKNPATLPGPPYHGHSNAPHLDGFWYKFGWKLPNPNNGQPQLLYEQYDFRNLFKMNL